MSINILVNGKPEQTREGTTVHELLSAIHTAPTGTRGIAVAVNEEVVRRVDWAERILGPGDSVEIVTAQQGG